MFTINPLNNELLHNGQPIVAAGINFPVTFSFSPEGPSISTNAQGNLVVQGHTADTVYNAVARFTNNCGGNIDRPFTFTGVAFGGASACNPITGLTVSPATLSGDAGTNASVSITIDGGGTDTESLASLGLPDGWSIESGSFPTYQASGALPDTDQALNFSVGNGCTNAITRTVQADINECESTDITSTVPVPKITTFPGQVSPPVTIEYTGADPVLRITVDPLASLRVTKEPGSGNFVFVFEAPADAGTTEHVYTIEAEDPCTGEVTEITGTYGATACPDPVVDVEVDCTETQITEPVDQCFLAQAPQLVENAAGEVSIAWAWNVNATGSTQWGNTPALGNSLTPETSLQYDAHEQRFAAGDAAASGTLFYFSISGTDADGNTCNAANPDRADGLWELARP